jgi:hypothetical protein
MGVGRGRSLQHKRNDVNIGFVRNNGLYTDCHHRIDQIFSSLRCDMYIPQ